MDKNYIKRIMKINKDFGKIMAYLVLTYVISWVFWGITIVLNNFYGLKISESPIITILWMIGGFGPTISIIVLLLKWKQINNFKELLRFIFHSPNLIKTTIVTLSMFIIQFLLLLLFLPRNDTPIYMVLTYLPVMVILGGLEEIGWRGFLQPQMEKTIPFILCLLFISIIWTGWHIPLFFIKGSSQNDVSFFVFFFGNLHLTCILAMIYKMTKNVFSCVLFHAWSNALYSVFEIKISTGFIVSYIVEIIVVVLICFLIKENKKKVLKY
jgi:membrane protease YdiL (CAAX protease family)